MTDDARALCMLEDLFMCARKWGVLSFEGSIPGTPSLVKFTLAAALAVDPVSVAPLTLKEPAVTAEPTAQREQKLGADGLTEEQQFELFGRPMDAKG